jgi:hypothetical protein
MPGVDQSESVPHRLGPAFVAGLAAGVGVTIAARLTTGERRAEV